MIQMDITQIQTTNSLIEVSRSSKHLIFITIIILLHYQGNLPNNNCNIHNQSQMNQVKTT